jgi:hypothetical protein
VAANSNDPQRNIEIIAKVVERIDRRAQTSDQTHQGPVGAAFGQMAQPGAAQLPPQVRQQLAQISQQAAKASGGAGKPPAQVPPPGPPLHPQGPGRPPGAAAQRTAWQGLAALLGSAAQTPGSVGQLGPAGRSLQRAIANTVASATQSTPFAMGAGGLPQTAGQVPSPQQQALLNLIRFQTMNNMTRAAHAGRMGQAWRPGTGLNLARAGRKVRDWASGAWGAAKDDLSKMVGNADAPTQSAAHGLDALGKVLPGPIAALLKFGSIALKAGDALQKWNRGIFNANMQFAQFSPAMAGVGARQMMRDIQLSRERGQRRAESAEYQAEGMSRFEKSWSRIEDVIAKGWNYASGAISNLAAGLLDIGNKNPEELDPQKKSADEISRSLAGVSGKPGGDWLKDMMKRARQADPNVVMTVNDMMRGSRWERYGRPPRFN